MVGNVGTLINPYQAQQDKIEQEKALADALQAGALRPQQGEQSYAQLFGQLAQALAAKHLQTKESAATTALDNQKASDYQTASAGLAAAMGGGSPGSPAPAPVIPATPPVAPTDVTVNPAAVGGSGTGFAPSMSGPGPSTGPAPAPGAVALPISGPTPASMQAAPITAPPPMTSPAPAPSAGPADPLTTGMSFLAAHPILAQSPQGQALVKAYQDRMTNDQKISGEPIRMRDANGNIVTVNRFESGRTSPVPGGYGALPDVTDVNGVATDLKATPTGTILPQNMANKVILGPDGKPMVNQPLYGFDTGVARAGKADQRTFVNLPPGETAYAGHLGGKLGDLDASTLEGGLNARKMYANANQIQQLADTAITGTAQGARAAVTRMMVSMGMAPPAANVPTEKLTQDLAIATYNQVKALGLGSRNYDTPQEYKNIQATANGSPGMTAAGIKALAAGQKLIAAESQRRAQAVLSRMKSNPATAAQAAGYDQQINAPLDNDMTPGQRAAAILRTRLGQ